MLRGEREKGRAERRVGPRREDDDRIRDPSIRNWTSAPSDRPIQFLCIVLTRSGQ
jgi:hypothetical protein